MAPQSTKHLYLKQIKKAIGLLPFFTIIIIIFIIIIIYCFTSFFTVSLSIPINTSCRNQQKLPSSRENMYVYRMESTRKLNNFNFLRTKPFYQNNFKNIAFSFTFFKGYNCN